MTSQFIAGSSNRRTAPFEGANAGAIPAPAASFGKSSIDPPGGEIESRLAYTQKSKGQNLSGRLAFAKATAQQADGLPRRSAERVGGSKTRRGSQFVLLRDLAGEPGFLERA